MQLTTFDTDNFFSTFIVLVSHWRSKIHLSVQLSENLKKTERSYCKYLRPSSLTNTLRQTKKPSHSMNMFKTAIK